MYNAADKTCILISATGSAIKAAEGVERDDGGVTFEFQPLLPIMKPSQGIVKACRKRFGDGNHGGGAPVRIEAVLGPGMTADTLIDKGLLLRLKGAVMSVAVRETFPSSARDILTGLEGETLEDGFFNRVRVSSGYKGESLVFDIDYSLPGVSASKVLAFLAGLANQPEISSVELEGEMILN